MSSRPNIQIIDRQNFAALEKLLRDVRLQGDKKLKIYEHARIRPRKYHLKDLSPTALYVLHSHLEQQKNMFQYLKTQGQNLFELTGFMDYRSNGQLYRLAAPIVEKYIEPTTGQEVAVIIDGLHRLSTARRLGIDEVWVIEISKLPTQLPPTPLPVTWDDVVPMDDIPDLKKRYRFTSPDAFPDLSAVTQVPITAENYLYFLYRDLSPLGSSGIRTK